jgi:hypothetical protein
MRSRCPTTLAVALCIILAACSDRDRDNPFDPSNPDTEGRPIKLTALPSDHFATLYWDIPERDDVVSGDLLRSFGGTAPASVLQGLLGSGSARDYLYPDSPLERTYWLEVTVDDWDQVHRSDTVLVLLSPGICWVGSGYDGVFLVSPSTSTLFPGMQLGSFLLDLSPERGGVWAAGAPGGMVYRVDESADSIALGEAFMTSLDVSSISAANSGLLLLAHSSGLTWFDPHDYRLDGWVDDAALEPLIVRLAPEALTAWVYTADSRLLRFLNPSPIPAHEWILSGVSAISPTSSDVCWIIAQDDLYRADAQNPSLDHVIQDVTALAARNDQECWVASWYQGTIRLVSAQGATIRSRTLSSPVLLTYAAADSVLWVGDAEHQIWKFLPDLRAAMIATLPADPWSLAAH